MGARGILRQPDSVRAQREGGVTHDAPEPVTAPKWLSRTAKAEFKRLVEELTTAEVPIKQIDSYAIAMTAYNITAVAEWIEKEQTTDKLTEQIECSKQITRYQRDCQKWLEMIAASPAARARLGMKTKEKKPGIVAGLIAMKKNAAG